MKFEMVTNQEMMTSDLEISTLKIQNEQLQNELKVENELTKRMNKSSEDVRYFEHLLRSPSSINDTSGLGYDRKGKYSRNGEKKNTKGKPTCHHYQKIGNTTNICKIKNGNHDPKQTTKGKSMKDTKCTKAT